MHHLSSRYRAPKGRPSKRKSTLAMNFQKKCSDQETKTTCTIEPNGQNASEKKLKTFPASKVAGNKEVEYTLLSSNSLDQLLSGIPCYQCGKKSLLHMSTDLVYGFSTKIQVLCSNCQFCFGESFTSERIQRGRMFDCNKKVVQAFLQMGRGYAAMEKFCISLGMNVMDRKTFSKCILELVEESKEFREKILILARNAVRQAHIELGECSEDNILDICVSYDGTWHKRGHTSNYGIGVVIDILTGLVVDFEILSKYCNECAAAQRDYGQDSKKHAAWIAQHKSEGSCSQNFDGSSSAMEVTAAERLWSRSMEVCKFRYSTVLSDGDAKTFCHLKALNVYGNSCIITKEECINHVAKRLSSGLMNKVKDCRAKGITLGGRQHGSLKKDTIIKLSNFFRKAIKENAPDIAKMKNSIYATLYHCISTDEKPQHKKCPTGESSWCFYNRALARAEKPPSHKCMKTVLSEYVVRHIIPVYQRVASDELLSRCTSARTQNANESLHSVIWSKCPKDIFVGRKRLEICATSAIAEFNMGCLAAAEALAEVQFSEMSDAAIKRCAKRDERRLQQSSSKISKNFRKQRKTVVLKKLREESAKKKKEGETYAPGGF